MRIKDKESSQNILIIISRAALAFLRWVTGGRVDLQYERRTTTLGRTMYTGTGWAVKSKQAKDREIAHEAVHAKQWETWGPLYYLTYLLNIWHVVSVPLLIASGAPWWVWALVMLFATCLPAGLSLRAYWEYKAFCETIRVSRKQGMRFNLAEDVEYYTDLLCGEPYFYAAMLIRPYVRKKWLRFMVSL